MISIRRTFFRRSEVCSLDFIYAEGLGERLGYLYLVEDLLDDFICREVIRLCLIG